jgi:hypothetical protein
MQPGVAAVMSIASRLWTIAAELVGGSLALLLVRGRPLPSPAPGDAAAEEPVPVPQQP